jgi:F0F1-type ATP synthase membrane subunit b/b'
MFQVSPLQLLMMMAFILFIVGLITFITGSVILILRSRNKEINAVTAQTSQIVKKGLAEDVAGLVGNASALLSAMNDLARTQNGIGVILILTGGVLMFISCYLLWYITFRTA